MNLDRLKKGFSMLAGFAVVGLTFLMAGCGDDGVETGLSAEGDRSADSQSSGPPNGASWPERSAQDSEGTSEAEVADVADDDARGSVSDSASSETGAASELGGVGTEEDFEERPSQSNGGAQDPDPVPSEMPAVVGGGQTASVPLRIVPIGDSITQGRLGNGSFDSFEASTLSYRYPLWQRFVDAGIDVDFVGSQTAGFGGDPAWEDYRGLPFDRDHEGHWGWRLDDIRDSLRVWLGEYEADLALIMLGTNDVNAGDSVSQMLLETEEIIAILREANPDVVIIWGHAFQEWDPFPAFREEMEVLASEMSTARSPIVTVSAADGWVSDPSLPASDTVDWVHPNLRGDQKLAEAFFEAIVTLFPIE